MNGKSKSTCNDPGQNLHQSGNRFDHLEHRFSDLLVNLSSISQDSTDDSDGLFKEIKTCKNITFTRSRSYFDDPKIFPVTPVRNSDKHPLLTSDEEDTSVHNSSSQCSKVNSCNSHVLGLPRSPLKAYTQNSLATPKSVERCARRNAPSFLYDSTQSSNSSRPRPLKNKPITPTSNDSSNNKENLNTPLAVAVSPVTSHVSMSLTLGGLSLNSPIEKDRTPLKKSNKKISKTSTPFNESVTSNMIFKTPVSSNKIATTPKVSALKRYSIDKAVASARKEFEEMAKTMKLKKRVLKTKMKEGNDSNLDATCEVSGSLTTRSSLFTTPTSTSKINGIKTPLAGITPKNGNSLTGIKKLDKQNEEHSSVSAKQSSNTNIGTSKDKTLSCGNNDDDDDDDIPSTQPAASILLRGIVAYVEVRFGRDYMSEGTKAELESLGAVVEKNFTRKVTHCFFHGGKMSTYRKAIEWKVPLVSTLWIEACKAEMQVLPLKGYQPHGLEKYKEELPLYKLKTKGLRRAVTDSKIRRKPWKEDELLKKTTQAVNNKPLPPVPIFNKADKVIDALHSVAGDLRKATNEFEKILTSPVLQKKQIEERSKEGASKSKPATNTSGCGKKRNKKLVFGSSSDDDKKKDDNNPSISKQIDTSSKISDINDSEIRVSYDSDDLLIYAKKQAANTRCSAPPRLLTSRRCKKLLSSCKDPQKKNGGISAGVKLNEEVSNSRVTTRRSKNNPVEGKRNEKEQSSEKPTQTKKRKLLLPSQVIADFEQDSGESTPPVSPNKCPYKVTPNKKPKTGLAVKSKPVRTLACVRVTSDCDSDDSLTRAARRESSALFVKKDKKTVPQKTTATIVCTSLNRSDEDVVKAIVAQLGKFTVESAVSERTTHVVTPAPRRTINLLKGIARGCWVLNVKWVYKSLEVGQWLPEERFELTEFSPAVKMARCDRQAFGPEFGLELFTGLGPFYVCRATVPPARDLAELLRLGGGCVVSNARAAKVVVGMTPPLSPCGRAPPLVVREKWVLDCITRLTRLDTTDYVAASGSEP